MQTILLVDDDPAVLMLYELMLNDLGYDVIPKPDAGSALELIRQGVPMDLVITDYQMPGMNGLEFIGVLRQILPSIPVLMLSGYCNADIDPGLGIGELISKPVSEKELGRSVKSALEKRSADILIFRNDRGIDRRPSPGTL